MSLNIRSIRHKFGQLEMHLNEFSKKPEVLCITESWLTNNEIPYVMLEGYKIASFYCRTQKNAGGCIIFVKNGIQILDFDLLKFSSESNIECCGTQIICPNKTFLNVMCVYRPPKGELKIFCSNMENILNNNKTQNSSWVLAGDFNINLFSHNSAKSEFISIMKSFNIFPTISNVNTRQSKHNSSLIDNVFTNIKNTKSRVVSNILSDHKTILCSIPMLNFKYPKIFQVKRVFSKQASENFLNALSKVSWNDLSSHQDPNKCFNIFLDRFLTCFNSNFKKKTLKIRKIPNKWWSDELSAMRNFITSHSHWKFSLNETEREIFKNCLQTYKNKIKYEKKKFNEEIINVSKNKNQALWKMFRSETGKNLIEPKNIELTINGQITDRPQLVLKELQNSFKPPIVNINPMTTNLTYLDGFLNSFYFFEASGNEIKNSIRRLKNTKCSGADEVPIFLIKNTADIIAEPLSICFNKFVNGGVYPKSLKHTRVQPLHKKGSVFEAGNYRGIHLVSNFSKIFESVFKERIECFTSNFKITAEHQHAYIHGKSTTTAISALLEYIYKQISTDQLVLVLFLDMTKAFDVINHDLLIRKLEKYGFRNNILSFFKSYLSDRTESIFINHLSPHKLNNSYKINCHESSAQTVECGTFQGTILGPTLFNLFLNDLFIKFKNFKVVSYADDICVSFYAPRIEELFAISNEGISQLANWFRDHGLLINNKKTSYMVFGSKLPIGPYPCLSIDNDFIEIKYMLNFLGLRLSSSLDWSYHMHHVNSKLNKICYAFRLLKSKVSSHHLLTIYHSVFLSHVRYALIFWGHSKQLIGRILITQKRCLRIIFGLKQGKSCKPLFAKHKLLTVVSLYILEIVKFVKLHIGELFNTSGSCHSYNTRSHLNVYMGNDYESMLEKRHNLYKQIYNKLPVSIQSLTGTKFKKETKKLLEQHCLYSLKQYFDTTFK